MLFTLISPPPETDPVWDNTESPITKHLDPSDDWDEDGTIVMCFAHNEAGFGDPNLYPSFKLEVKPVLESLGITIPEDSFDHHCTYTIARWQQQQDESYVASMSRKQVEQYIIGRLTALDWSYVPVSDSAYTHDLIPFYEDFD
jgi:hypothetical protein